MKKRIAIIGSGIIGCIVALYLKKNGHDVCIYEKNSFAGGILKDSENNNNIFLTGTQYLDSNEEWFKEINKIDKDLISADYSYGSYTNLNKRENFSEEYALPVFKIKIDEVTKLDYKNKILSLLDHIKLYPEKIYKSLKVFLENSELELNSISNICKGNLGISRIGALNNIDKLLILKKKKMFDDIYAVNRERIYKNKLKYSIPSNGYDNFFKKIQIFFKKKKINIFLRKKVIPVKTHNGFDLKIDNKILKFDYIFWSGNPTPLIKEYFNKKLDSFVFRTTQISANLNTTVDKFKFIQVYKKKCKIFRISLYKIKNISKINIECFFNKDDPKNIIDDSLKILKKFNITLSYDKNSISNFFLPRFDIFTNRDQLLIDSFLNKTKKTNLLYSPWTTYGRTEKLYKILKNLKSKKII